MKALFRKTWAALGAALFLFAAITNPPVAGADELGTVRYGISDVTDTLADSIARGAVTSRSILYSMGPEVQAALDGIGNKADFSYTNFSARSQIEILYALAEKAKAGEGDRFLAKLHRKLADDSAAVMIDKTLVDFSKSFDKIALRAPLQFAPPASITSSTLTKLPPAVEKVIEILAYHSAGKDVGSAVDLFRKHLNLSKAETELSVASARNIKDMLIRIAAKHVPPPPIEVGMQGILYEAIDHSAALSIDADVQEALEKLGDEPLAAPRRSFRHAIPNLASYRSEVPFIGENADKTLSGKTVEDYRTKLRQDLFPKTDNHPELDLEKFKENHRRYLAASLMPADKDPVIPPGQPRPVPPAAPSINPSLPNFELPKVPRAYKVAIRSARAARGVAVGGPLESDDVPVSATYWIPSSQDDLYGRFVIISSTAKGREIFASSFLFSDSMEAAASTLWGDWGEDEKFREGNVTIAVSLDPFSSLTSGYINAAVIEYLREAAVFKSIAEIEGESETNTQAQYDAFGALEIKLQHAPKAIVVHPALVGKQLAWSAERVDFWFRDMGAIKDEIASVEQASQAPDGYEDFLLQADTWQFYERENHISLSNGKIAVDSRDVESGGAYDSPNHFSVSLFYLDEPQGGDENPLRLSDDEHEIQPYLDWMFTSHPDFVRLNDYSEALSILRWLNAKQVRVTILDADGPEYPILAPDKILANSVGPSR